MNSFDLDRRTRRDQDRHSITAVKFFAETMPGAIATHGSLVAAGIAALEAPPLTIEVEGSTWTITRADHTIEVREGSLEGALIVTFSPEEFSDWAQNQITLNGFLVARTLRFRDGTLADVSAWDSLWIALLEGWPVTDDRLDFINRQGQVLDLNASFTPDDDPADIAHFLRETGYVRLRGWLDPTDMSAISADMDRALPLYREGDGKSWWATLADGARTCVRLQEFVEHSPTTARILSSDRWDNLRRILAGSTQLEPKPPTGRIIEALFKPVGVVSGPSDLAFHRDCLLGRHAYDCVSMTVGIALTPSDEANGVLRVVAGSHRLAIPVEVAQTRSYLPIVALPTEPGDLTVHLSCTLHEATAPITAERRVMYTALTLAPRGAKFTGETAVSDIRESISDILRDAEANC